MIQIGISSQEISILFPLDEGWTSYDVGHSSKCTVWWKGGAPDIGFPRTSMECFVFLGHD